MAREALSASNPLSSIAASRSSSPRCRMNGIAECVNLFETIFRKKFYAAMGSGGLMNTIGLSAGGSGVPCTKRLGLRAYAA